jgi:hypothetical protein
MNTLERLREAWKIAPAGSRVLVYTYGYTHQTISSILKNGRKNEATIFNLLASIKRSSAEITKDVNEQNNKVQKL